MFIKYEQALERSPVVSGSEVQGWQSKSSLSLSPAPAGPKPARAGPGGVNQHPQPLRALTKLPKLLQAAAQWDCLKWHQSTSALVRLCLTTRQNGATV